MFQKGEIKKPNGQYTSIAKSIPQPKPIKVDPKFERFFKKDVKEFIARDVKNVAVSMAKNLENMLTAPQKITDLFSNLATSMNSPILLPVLIIVGAVVVVNVIKK